MTDAPGADWLLDDLVDRVPAARQAVVLSVDGLLTGKSHALSRTDAEHLAAIASGFAGLARAAGRHFRGGPVRQTIVEMEQAFLFVTAASNGSCLAVWSDTDSDIGLLAYEMAMVVERIGHAIATVPRQASPRPAGLHHAAREPAPRRSVSRATAPRPAAVHRADAG
jgi:predicted regulator of Ras-like GTPase activity (Roadblock/LC7/MglB family)